MTESFWGASNKAHSHVQKRWWVVPISEDHCLLADRITGMLLTITETDLVLPIGRDSEDSNSWWTLIEADEGYWKIVHGAHQAFSSSWLPFSQFPIAKQCKPCFPPPSHLQSPAPIRMLQSNGFGQLSTSNADNELCYWKLELATPTFEENALRVINKFTVDGYTRFTQSAEDQDSLSTKIGFAIFGPPNEVEGTASGYSRIHHRAIDPILTAINKRAADGQVWVRVVFVVADSGGLCYPYPLFRILRKNGNRDFIDQFARVYTSWQVFLEANVIKNPRILCRDNGDRFGRHYTVTTPFVSTSSTAARFGDWGFTGFGIASVIINVVGITLSTPLALGVPLFAFLYSTGRSAHHIFDRAKHEQIINPLTSEEARISWLTIAGGGLGFGAAVGSTIVRVASIAPIANHWKSVVTGLNLFSLGSNALSLANSMFGIYFRFTDENKYPSPLEVAQIATAVVFFSMNVRSFRSASQIIEDTRRDTARFIKTVSKVLEKTDHSSVNPSNVNLEAVGNPTNLVRYKRVEVQPVIADTAALVNPVNYNQNAHDDSGTHTYNDLINVDLPVHENTVNFNAIAAADTGMHTPGDPINAENTVNLQPVNVDIGSLGNPMRGDFDPDADLNFEDALLNPILQIHQRSFENLPQDQRDLFQNQLEMYRNSGISLDQFIEFERSFARRNRINFEHTRENTRNALNYITDRQLNVDGMTNHQLDRARVVFAQNDMWNMDLVETTRAFANRLRTNEDFVHEFGDVSLEDFMCLGEYVSKYVSNKTNTRPDRDAMSAPANFPFVDAENQWKTLLRDAQTANVSIHNAGDLTFSSISAAAYHYFKHRGEFGVENVRDYIAAANNAMRDRNVVVTNGLNQNGTLRQTFTLTLDDIQHIVIIVNNNIATFFTRRP